MNGTGDMTDDNVKIDGKYKFRLIPYKTSIGDSRLSPDNNTRYIEWTQTNNPTSIDYYENVTGFADYSFAGEVNSDTNDFTGLKYTSNGNQAYAMLTGSVNREYSVYTTEGPPVAPFNSRKEVNMTGDTYQSPDVIELYMLIKKASGNPVVEIPKVVDVTGAIYDASAVNYANVYLYGTDGNTNNDAMAKQTIDNTEVFSNLSTISNNLVDHNTSSYDGLNFVTLKNGDIVECLEGSSDRNVSRLFDNKGSILDGTSQDGFYSPTAI